MLQLTREHEDYDSDLEFNTRAGINLGELTVTEVGGDDDTNQDDVWSEWPHDRLDVNWLTDPGPQELGEATFVHLTVSGPLALGYVAIAGLALTRW